MKRNAMSLKAIINNIAKENNVSAQSILQTYMLERLLERISISKYKNNFILKGGMLISAMLGIDSRTTMDMDTTIKGFKLTEENISKIINEICNISIDDEVNFEVKKIELIREDDDYGGYRVTFEAKYMDTMPVIMKIDITTGDIITYKEIKYSFDLMLEDRKIEIWSYNIETIIAEKFESIHCYVNKILVFCINKSNRNFKNSIAFYFVLIHNNKRYITSVIKRGEI